MHIMDHLKNPDLKRAYTRRIFTVVAPKYNAVTRALSFFRDAAWKKHLLGMLTHVGRHAVILDTACGTGDIALLLARAFPAGRIVGCDCTFGMLRIAASRLSAVTNIALSSQDMSRLAIKDSAIDLVTGGYALRNAPDLSTSLREIARVLKAGGTAAFLDFSKSHVPCIAAMQLAALFLWGGLWGLLFHGRPSVYAYIARSLATYPDRNRLHRLFEEAGFTIRDSRARMLGFIRMDVIQKTR